MQRLLLLAALRIPIRGLRLRVIVGLVNLRDPRVVPDIVELLQNRGARVRWEAVWALGYLVQVMDVLTADLASARRKALDNVLLGLVGSSADVQAWAVQRVGEGKDDKSVPYLS